MTRYQPFVDISTHSSDTLIQSGSSIVLPGMKGACLNSGNVWIAIESMTA
jgi:hypothetical protein